MGYPSLDGRKQGEHGIQMSLNKKSITLNGGFSSMLDCQRVMVLNVGETCGKSTSGLSCHVFFGGLNLLDTMCFNGFSTPLEKHATTVQDHPSNEFVCPFFR